MSASTLSLSEKILSIEEGLLQGRLPHAFGGAIALAYYATPRATVDIDVNVFVEAGRAEDVLALLGRLGAEPIRPSEQTRLQRDGQARIAWGATPVDLFFSYDAFHDSCLERRRVQPFGDGESIHVLSAEDLVVFKILFDREKDRRDVTELIYAQADQLDTAYVRAWLERIVGREDERFAWFEGAVERYA